MSDQQIAHANHTLAHPPLFDPSGQDRLGLFVAARLARQHRIQVTLRHSLYGGVTAVVLIPLDLVVDSGSNGSQPGNGVGSMTRSPDTARDVLSAFQNGLRRGRSEAQSERGRTADLTTGGESR